MTLLESFAVAGGPLATGFREQTGERRGDPRFAVRERARLFWNDRLEVPCEEAVTVLNTSVGVSLLTSIPLRPGDAMRLQTDRHAVRCLVRHVQALGTRSWVGVEVLPRSKWSAIACAVERLGKAIAARRIRLSGRRG